MEKNPDAEIRVYVVWARTLRHDPLTGVVELMPDPRALHLWDEGAAVGQWFPKQEEYRKLTGPTPRLDSFYFVYGSEARWNQIPSPVIGSGHPVLAKRKDLQRVILPLLSVD